MGLQKVILASGQKFQFRKRTAMAVLSLACGSVYFEAKLSNITWPYLNLLSLK